MDISESEASDCDNPADDDDDDWAVRCFSCSTKSQCKTSKCECRSTGAACGDSCGCLPTICSNRETHTIDTPTVNENKEAISGKSSELVSQGAALLQSAFGENPAAQNDNEGYGLKRKPLSDIGNQPPNVPKPNQRKKWGKQVVQLIPVSPSPADQPKNANMAVKKLDESTVDGDLPLKLPRAMRAPAPSSGSSSTLRERNYDPSNGPSHSKGNASQAPTSPPRRVPMSDEK